MLWIKRARLDRNPSFSKKTGSNDFSRRWPLQRLNHPGRRRSKATPEWWGEKLPKALWEVFHCISLAWEWGKLQIRSLNFYETQFDVRAFCSPNSLDYSAGGSFCWRRETFIAVVKEKRWCEFASACSLRLPVPRRSLWPRVCAKMEPTLAQVWNMGCM